jgi:regulatory protein
MNRLDTKEQIELYALKLLGFKEWTYYLLKRKILEHSDQEDIIDEVLNIFIEQNLLSDERYAKSYILNSRDNKGYGPEKISAMLKSKGVSSKIIDKHLYESHPIWERNAFNIRERKYGALPSDIKEKSKQGNFLQNKGFTFSQIETAFLTSLPDHCLEIENPEGANSNISLSEIKDILKAEA